MPNGRVDRPLNKFEPGEDWFRWIRWLRDHHITDWPADCVPVLKLLYCAMNNCRMALILGWPKREVAAWHCFIASRAGQGFLQTDIYDMTEVPAQQWVRYHAGCCLKQEIWDLLYRDEYPEATRRGLLQPREYHARLLVRPLRFHPDWLVRCQGTRPPSIRRLRRVVYRHGCSVPYPR